MGKLYVIIGKSAAGKDTISNHLLEDGSLGLQPVVPYTTRPLRQGESEGVGYHFRSLEEYQELLERGQVIEHRSYETVFGEWIYFTVDDGQIDLAAHSSLTVGTLDSLESFRRYFGEAAVVPIYIEVDDGERLQRALDRERGEKSPKYDELCRRFLADQSDMSEENLQRAGITARFENTDCLKTVAEIAELIKGEQNGDKG